jgi:hypothetical protein
MTTNQVPEPEESSLISATKFLSDTRTFNHIDRDIAAVDAVLAGNVPTHMREFVDVLQTFKANDGSVHALTLHVLPDVLCIGTDDDYVRISLNPLQAQRLCDAWNCSLITPHISNVIWHAAVTKLQPIPWGPPYDASMMSSDRIVVHSRKIDKQLESINGNVTTLIAGHKKDVVLTNKLVQSPTQVAIFGWHQSDGKPIQPLYLGHENTYADYSHGIRLLSLTCELDDESVDLRSILQDANFCRAVSDEGPLKLLRQPLT